MTGALETMIRELRQGAELSVEGACAVPWRQRIQRMAPLSVASHGPGLFIIGQCAKNLLLQRGQVRPQSDEALRGVLIEIANILDLEQQAQEAQRSNRQAARRAEPYWRGIG